MSLRFAIIKFLVFLDGFEKCCCLNYLKGRVDRMPVSKIIEYS